MRRGRKTSPADGLEVQDLGVTLAAVTGLGVTLGAVGLVGRLVARGLVKPFQALAWKVRKGGTRAPAWKARKGGTRALAGVGDPPGRASCPVCGGARTPARDGVLDRVIAHGVGGGVTLSRGLRVLVCLRRCHLPCRPERGLDADGGAFLIPDEGPVLASDARLGYHGRRGAAVLNALADVVEPMARQLVTQ